MNTTTFLNYYPFHFYPDVLPEDEVARHFVRRFKEGNVSAVVTAAAILNTRLRAIYKEEELKKLTFFPLPASSPERHRMRYWDFAEYLCAITGMQNGYDLLKVTHTHEPLHETRVQEEPNELRDVNYEVTEALHGRRAVIFDDVLTTGHSLNTFADELTINGAHIERAFALAKTIGDPMKSARDYFKNRQN